MRRLIVNLFIIVLLSSVSVTLLGENARNRGSTRLSLEGGLSPAILNFAWNNGNIADVKPGTGNGLPLFNVKMANIKMNRNVANQRLPVQGSPLPSKMLHVETGDNTPGIYLISINGATDNTIGSGVRTKIQITAIPSIWLSWWFRGLMLLFIAGLLFLLYRSGKRFRSNRQVKESALNKFFEKHNISNREMEIIRLVAEGKSNKEIEDALFISIKTVKSHVYNIYKKLGIKSRVQLINLVNVGKRKLET